MSFQGKVVNADGTNVTDGTYTFVFKLYTASSGGSAIWTETDSSVTVTAGVFQVNLGANCPFFTANACNGSTPINFSTSNSLYLGITFNSDPAGEMTPRVQLQSVPYAFYADNAGSLGGLAASNYVQLSPAGQQSGNINVSGTGTFGNTLTIQGGGAQIAGDITGTGRLNLPMTTGTTGQGFFVLKTSSVPITSFQGVDNGTNSFGFFAVNKYFNGTAWVDDGQSRVGSSFQIQDDSFNFYSFDTAANFTSRFVVAHGGDVGIGSNVTPGFLLDVQGGDINTSANVRTAGTIRLDNAGNLTNIGNITSTGTTTHTGTVTVNTGTANQLQVTSGANVPTADQLNITNTGSTGVTAAGINGLSINYKGGAAAVEAAAQRIDIQPGTTSGGTWDGLRIVPNATGAVTGVTENGLKIDNLTTPGAGTENALLVGTGWDNVLQATNASITQTGTIKGVTINATTAYQANGTAGINLGACGNGTGSTNLHVQEGIVTGGACGNDGLSDQRLKTDIATLPNSALDSIKNVNPVNFYFDCTQQFFSESQTYCDTTLQTGVIAQQLANIFPTLVTQNSYGYYQVNYQGLAVENLKAVSEIAQHLDSAGNANLNNLTVQNLTVLGSSNVGSGGSGPTGNFANSVVTPHLTSDGALVIDSGSAGNVSIDSGGGAVNIGTGGTNAVNIANAGATTDVKGALV